MARVPITLKWGKISHTIDLKPGSSAADFKLSVQSLTGVPVHRQKLLCPKVWRGALKDGDALPEYITHAKGSKPIVVTLIGNADTLVEVKEEERPKFAEDMTPEELWKATRSNGATGEDGDIIDIPALQKEPGMERDDGKMEVYEYNRLVTGLPQHQIDDILIERRREAEAACGENQDASVTLKGEVAMTLGLELRRAYVNSLAVLRNGTIVSGLDDGHVQLWRRGMLVKDARHTSGRVDLVHPFPLADSVDPGSGDPSFVSAGDGSICLWTEDGNELMSFGSFPGTTPASIAVGTTAGSRTYLAACFRVSRQVDHNQFRLLPQNEAERRRRETAEVQERMIQEELMRASRCVKIWYHEKNESNDTFAVRNEILLPSDLPNEVAPISKLLDTDGQLVCGDIWGCIRIYDWVQTAQSAHQSNYPPVISTRQSSLAQFRGSSIACMERIGKNMLAISIQPSQESNVIPSAVSLPVNSPRGVYILDTTISSIKAILNAHSDVVTCIRSLPDGGLLTAGGRMDATVRVWSCLRATIKNDNGVAGDEVNIFKEARLMKQPGYVFDLQVLPDSGGSKAYAVAAARYNVIKVVI